MATPAQRRWRRKDVRQADSVKLREKQTGVQKCELAPENSPEQFPYCKSFP